MAEFTFLKLQLDDASFTANAPLSGEEPSDEERDGSGSRSLLPFFAGLVFLFVVAVAVRKFRGRDSE
jgi:hypothetical protein